MTFEPGQKVLCIDDADSKLIAGHVYTIEKVYVWDDTYPKPSCGSTIGVDVVGVSPLDPGLCFCAKCRFRPLDDLSLAWAHKYCHVAEAMFPRGK